MVASMTVSSGSSANPGSFRGVLTQSRFLVALLMAAAAACAGNPDTGVGSTNVVTSLSVTGAVSTTAATPPATESAPATISTLAPDSALETAQGRFRVLFEYRDDDQAARLIDAVEVEALMDASLSHIDRILPGPPVTIRLQSDADLLPDFVRPGFDQWGVVARAGSRNVEVFINPSAPIQVETLLTEVVPATLAHEIHHTVREEALGAGAIDFRFGTLLDLLVSEGAATVFQEEAFPGWEQTELRLFPEDAEPLSLDQQREVWQHAQPLLDAQPPQFDPGDWFGHTGDLPPQTGYKLGAALIRAYLETHPNATAASLATVPSQDIPQQSHYQP